MPKKKTHLSRFKVTPLLIFLIVLIPVVIYAALTQTNILGRAYIPSYLPDNWFPPSSSIELVSNGSFEAKTIQAQLPDSWDWQSSKLSKGEGQNCSTALSEKCSFIFLNPDTKSILGQYITNIPPNLTSVNLTFYAKASAVNKSAPFYAYVNLYNKDGQSVGYFETHGTVKKTWTLFSRAYPVNSDVDHITIQFRFMKRPGLAKVWLDKVSLKGSVAPTPTPPPTIPTPTIKSCSNEVKSISYSSPYSSNCSGSQATFVNFTCQNGATGTFGDGVTCQDEAILKTNATNICQQSCQ